MGSDASADVSARLASFADSLSANERDALKFRLSVVAAAQLDDSFELSRDPERQNLLSMLLRCLLEIQPYGKHVPKYGIAYLGRPGFMTDALVHALRTEAVQFRPSARENFEQYIVTVDTKDDSTVCERLAASDEMAQLVNRHAGPCIPSFITSYIYYDAPRQCSKPHVDNAFTAVTVMIGLRHDCPDSAARPSASVAYWPDRPPIEYRLAPGELAVFFGICVLHGRYPVSPGETVHSLLLSFKPKPVTQEDSYATG